MIFLEWLTILEVKVLAIIQRKFWWIRWDRFGIIMMIEMYKNVKESLLWTRTLIFWFIKEDLIEKNFSILLYEI